MNLDDLKGNWDKIEDQSKASSFSDQEIQVILEKKGKTNYIKSWLPEVLVLLINIYLIFFLVVFNGKFENQLLRSSSFLCIVLLIMQSVLIYSTIRLFRHKLKLSVSYHQTIQQTSNECKKLNQRYYAILGLSMIILLLCVVLLPKVYSENLTNQQMIISYAVSLVFLSYLSYRIYKYYKRLIMNNKYFNMKLIQE